METASSSSKRCVAVQVDPFESKGLKPVSHFIGSRVELKPGGFKRYGSTGFNLYSPHCCLKSSQHRCAYDVAVQAASERHVLKQGL
jgi:hypothetical protein